MQTTKWLRSLVRKPAGKAALLAKTLWYYVKLDLDIFSYKLASATEAWKDPFTIADMREDIEWTQEAHERMAERFYEAQARHGRLAHAAECADTYLKFSGGKQRNALSKALKSCKRGDFDKEYWRGRS